MRKAMTIALLTLLCMLFTGCKDSGGPVNQQPEIKIKHTETDNTYSHGTSEKQNNETTPDNSDNTETEHNDSEIPPVTPEYDANAESEHNETEIPSATQKYELASLANDDVSIISGKEYDYSETNMHGSVLGIGKYTVTLSRAFTAEYTPDGKYIDENTMVSPEDPDEQAREYVQFTENSTFTLRETKNSGASVKDSAATFEDIKVGDLLDIKGYYTDGLFTVTNTIIYRNLDVQK